METAPDIEESVVGQSQMASDSMSVSAPPPGELKEEGVDIAVSGEAAEQAAADMLGDDEEGLELGDRISLSGGRYNGTRGKIYYIDDDLIRILPDGLSDRLVDIPIVDGEIDPALKLEDIVILKKRPVPSFVEIFDIRAGQLAETFTASGEPGPEYMIKEANGELDKVLLEEETGGQVELEFAFRGIPRETMFAVIRSQEAPKAEKPENEKGQEEQAQAQAQAEEAEPEFDLEFLDEVEVPIFEEVAEIATSKRVFTDLAQKDDMLQDLIKRLDPAQQKNLRKISVLRRLVESMTQLRNDLVKYNRAGQATGTLPTSFDTLAQLLDNAEFPLAKQVVGVARSVYLDHSHEHIEAARAGQGGSDPMELTDKAVDINYLEDAVREGISYYETQLATPITANLGVSERKVPRWHTVWEGFFQNYFKVLPANTDGEKKATTSDKDVFRGELPMVSTEEATLTGIPNLEGADSRVLVSTDFIGKVPYSYVRSIGSRVANYGEKVATHVVEQADEAELYAYVLFPLLFIRDLGTTRTGQFALDMAQGAAEPKTMKMILEEGGDVSDIPTPNGILSVRPDGSSLGNIEIADWLKGQAIYGGGIADLMPFLRSFGLDSKELTVEQKAILNKKIELYQANVKKFLQGLRSKAKAQEEGAAQTIVNQLLLTPAAEEALFKILENEKLLLDAVADFGAHFPSYAKNDIARFAALYTQFQDLTVSVLGGSAEGVAIERRRVVRDQFLKSLRDALALQKKVEMSGQPPQPNPCEHVENLENIRKVKDNTDRMKIMIKFLNEYRGEKKDHWIECSVCNQHLLCEHEYLILQEYLHPREKDVIHKQLLLTFSGGEFNGKFICKHCGQPIADLEFDTSLEYDDAGNPMMGRAVLVDDDALADEEYAKVLAVENEEAVKIDFGGEDEALIYRTINQIAALMGVYPDRPSYMKMVSRVQGVLAKFPDRQRYALIQKAEEKSRKGRGEAAGDKVDYDIFINRNMVGLCGAALLIDVQTHMPDYVVRYTLQGCAKPEFTGFPMDKEEDKSGVDYISCAIASIMRRENPWDLTGFQAISSDVNRQKRIALFIFKFVKDLVNTPEVQQDIATKKQYLQETYGAEAQIGRPKDKIPEGFTPEQIVLPKVKAESAEAPIIDAAADPKQKARAWIIEGHKLARVYGKYLATSVLSEASCCYSPLMSPGEFWRTQVSMPALDRKSPPKGPRGSMLYVHMIPRPLDHLFGKPDASIMYRLFMRVCFQGPRVGLQHEPGYNQKCPWCGLQFPDDPRLPAPLPRFAKDGGTQKKYDEEYVTAINERAGAQIAALGNQGITVSKDSFDELLSQSNRRFLIPPMSVATIPSRMDNMRGLLTLNPPPFEDYLAVMNLTIEQVSALPPDADKAQIAIAFGALSEASVQFETNLSTRLGSDKYAALGELMSYSPRTLGESLRTYFLLPFQRAITKKGVSSLLAIQKRYDLSTETQGDIQKFLGAHLEGYTKIAAALEKSDFGRAKVREAIAKLSVVIPLFVKVLRSNIISGGPIGLEFIQRAIVSGILSEFIDPNHVPALDEGNAEAPARAVSAKANLPIQILGLLLNQFRGEGLNFTGEQIRTKIADRNEKEKQKVIKEFDVLDKEGKRLELMNKKLGLGRWSVGGTKVIWQYDEDQYVRDKVERAAAGISDDPRFQAEFSEFAPEGEGGYDVEQTAADDA